MHNEKKFYDKKADKKVLYCSAVKNCIMILPKIYKNI